MDADATRIDGTLGNDVSQQTDATQQGKDSSKMHSTIAGVTGLGLGAVGTVVIGKIIDASHKINELTPDQEEVAEGTERPAWAVGDIEIAKGVNDDMSFSEAFAAAREEVGPGGAFEWNGGVYGTYTASEWNQMSVSERAEFNDNFSWNHVNATSGNVATVQPIEVHHHHHHYNIIEEVEVVNEPQSDIHVEAQPVNQTIEAQPEIEVLGVVHDYETGANIGGLNIDGQDIVVVDVDGDLEFDLAASDFNHNNEIEEGEVLDIHGQGLTVDDLGGFTDPNDAIQASDDIMAMEV